jgi:hypothetical protein
MVSIIVAGSRDFDDYDLLKEKLDKVKAHLGIFEVVSGKARGADSLGERYARENNLPIAAFPADWDKYGKSAGYRRNEDMADYAEGCIVFWDGISKGTQHMINLAKEKELNLAIVNYDGSRKGFPE